MLIRGAQTILKEGGEVPDPRRAPSRGTMLMRRWAAVTLATLCTALVVSGGAGASRPAYAPPMCPLVKFHSAPTLGAQRACQIPGAPVTRGRAGTYLFLSQGAAGGGIFSSNGMLVWWQPHPVTRSAAVDLSVVKLWGKSYLALWSGSPHYVKSINEFYTQNGTVALYDNHYQQVGTITAAPPFAPDSIDLHEFRMTPQGDALVHITQLVRRKIKGHREYIAEDVVQKLSLVRDSTGIHTGKLIFQWDSLKHVPVSRSYWPNPGAGGVWDYFHLNSIAQDTDGNLIISGRNTWGIYKVNVRTGRTMWQVGGKGDSRLRKFWCYQHDVTPVGGNEYTVFDNGGIGPYCALNTTFHPARGLIIRVNPRKRPAGVRLIHAYTHNPPIYVNATGSMRRLPHGNVLIDWGGVPEITQYSATGRVELDLALSGWSYRGYRSSWIGQPLTPPAVAAQRQAGRTQVWCSWNGATQVVAWRVLAGVTPATLVAVTGAVRKQAFETHIALGKSYPYVGVQALGVGGQVLGTSTTISPSGS